MMEQRQLYQPKITDVLRRRSDHNKEQKHDANNNTEACVGFMYLMG